MRVLVQRVISSSVEVEGKIVGRIRSGVLLFVGFTNDDGPNEIKYMVDKIVNLPCMLMLPKEEGLHILKR